MVRVWLDKGPSATPAWFTHPAHLRLSFWHVTRLIRRGELHTDGVVCNVNPAVRASELPSG
jgi:hypothetical protein